MPACNFAPCLVDVNLLFVLMKVLPNINNRFPWYFFYSFLFMKTLIRGRFRRPQPTELFLINSIFIFLFHKISQISKIIQFVISTVTPIFFIEISFVFPPPPQPPIELLRQFLDGGGWFDRKSLQFMSIGEVNLLW